MEKNPIKVRKHRSRRSIYMFWGLFFILALCLTTIQAQADRLSQIPTVAIPTVTGTPVGAIAIVRTNDEGLINVRAGPSSVYFEIVGVLVSGAEVPALGRTPGGDWVEIAYPGVSGGVAWVYVDLVDIKGTLPIVEPPPTPTPRTTPTIDPTLAAQFLVDIPPTRLPTFTPPGPIVVPTFTEAPLSITPARVPMGLILVVMASIGMFGALISLLGRR
jgi:uncharacterized protein YraI